jgi:hypothetical protein
VAVLDDGERQPPEAGGGEEVRAVGDAIPKLFSDPAKAREAARLYRRQGLTPIPIPFKKKGPNKADWQDTKYADEADLDRAFPARQAMNVGALTGPANLVVDLDCSEAVDLAPSYLPDTGKVSGREGVPGSHWHYRGEGEVKKTMRFNDGQERVVELLATGSQVVMPPSVHPSGEKYVWHRYGQAATVAYADLLASVKKLAAAVLLARHWPDEGTRHQAALALAGGLANAGWTEEDAEAFLTPIFELVDEESEDRLRAVSDTFRKAGSGENLTGWPTLAGLIGEKVVTQVRDLLGISGSLRVVNSGHSGHSGQCVHQEAPEPIPFTKLPEVPPFPLDTLPPGVDDFVPGVAEALHCPADYVAVPALVLAGHAAGANQVIEIKPGCWERPALYAAVVAPASSGKSPALRAVASPVYAEQEVLYSAYRQEVERWKDSDRQGRRPVGQSVYVANTTTEKLAGLLLENPRGLVMIQDELTAWVAALNQYKAGGKGADQQFYLSAWAGEPIKVDRKNQEDGSVYVARPFLSVAGGLPPTMLYALRGQAGAGDGWLARVLFTYPTPWPAGPETWGCVDASTAAAWGEALRRLRDLPQGGTLTAAGEINVYRLSEGGRSAWEALTRRLASDMNALDPNDPLYAAFGKMRGYAARLSLIVHLLWGTEGDVRGEEVEAADKLVAYFQAHARKVYGSITTDPRVDDALYMLRKIPAHSGKGQVRLSKRDIYRECRGRWRTVGEMGPALELLAQHHYLIPLPDQGRSGPGRKPSSEYLVNPKWRG